MKTRTKQELQSALARILEYAKCHRDLANSEAECDRWSHVVTMAYNALCKPTIADLDVIRHKAAMSDLTASGGMVDHLD